MGIDFVALLLLYIFFLFLSFFFSGSEAGYFSLNRAQFESDVTKKPSAKRIAHLVYQMDYLLILLLFGNNLSNIMLTNLSQSIGKGILGENYGTTSEILINVVTVIILFSFGEVFPKFLFRRYPNRLVYATSKLLNFFEITFTPILFLLHRITRGMSELIFKKSKELVLSREDVGHIFHDSNQSGLIDKEETYLLRTFSYISKTRVMEMMVPVTDLYLIEKSDTIEEHIPTIKKNRLSHVFIYEKRIDNIIGYISITDVFNNYKKGKTAKEYLVTTQYIPFLNTLDDIYHRFANSDKVALIVVDEYGGCCGIITQRDFIERLFGFNYKKPNGRGKKAGIIHRVHPHLYEIDTLFDVDDFNRIFGISLPKSGYETMAGFIYWLFGYIPKEGFSVEYEEMTFTILKATEKSVDVISVEFSKERYQFEEKSIQFFETTKEEKN